MDEIKLYNDHISFLSTILLNLIGLLETFEQSYSPLEPNTKSEVVAIIKTINENFGETAVWEKLLPKLESGHDVTNNDKNRLKETDIKIKSIALQTYNLINSTIMKRAHTLRSTLEIYYKNLNAELDRQKALLEGQANTQSGIDAKIKTIEDARKKSNETINSVKTSMDHIENALRNVYINRVLGAPISKEGQIVTKDIYTIVDELFQKMMSTIDTVEKDVVKLGQNIEALKDDFGAQIVKLQKTTEELKLSIYKIETDYNGKIKELHDKLGKIEKGLDDRIDTLIDTTDKNFETLQGDLDTKIAGIPETLSEDSDFIDKIAEKVVKQLKEDPSMKGEKGDKGDKGESGLTMPEIEKLITLKLAELPPPEISETLDELKQRMGIAEESIVNINQELDEYGEVTKEIQALMERVYTSFKDLVAKQQDNNNKIDENKKLIDAINQSILELKETISNINLQIPNTDVIQKINEQLAELSQKVNGLPSGITGTLQSAIDDLKNRVGILEDTTKQLNEEDVKLNKKLDDMNEQLTAIRADINNLKEKGANKSDIEHLSTEVFELGDKIQEISKQAITQPVSAEGLTNKTLYDMIIKLSEDIDKLRGKVDEFDQTISNLDEVQIDIRGKIDIMDKFVKGTSGILLKIQDDIKNLQTNGATKTEVEEMMKRLADLSDKLNKISAQPVGALPIDVGEINKLKEKIEFLENEVKTIPTINTNLSKLRQEGLSMGRDIDGLNRKIATLESITAEVRKQLPSQTKADMEAILKQVEAKVNELKTRTETESDFEGRIKSLEDEIVKQRAELAKMPESKTIVEHVPLSDELIKHVVEKSFSELVQKHHPSTPTAKPMPSDERSRAKYLLKQIYEEQSFDIKYQLFLALLPYLGFKKLVNGWMPYSTGVIHLDQVTIYKLFSYFGFVNVGGYWIRRV